MNYGDFGASCYDGYCIGLITYDQEVTLMSPVWNIGSQQVNYCFFGGSCNNNLEGDGGVAWALDDVATHPDRTYGSDRTSELW